MHHLVNTGAIKSHSSTPPRAATPETDNSASRVARHLGRAIVGWLTIIIVIQLAVKYFGAN